jgi:hypothetical protein
MLVGWFVGWGSCLYVGTPLGLMTSALRSDDCGSWIVLFFWGGGGFRGRMCVIIRYCKTTGRMGRCERKPATDGCNGHFGPVPGRSGLVYHYHSSVTAPYTVACYGPSWGQCDAKGLTAFCKTECPRNNTVAGLCVASGYQSTFDLSAQTFGAGYKGTGCGGIGLASWVIGLIVFIALAVLVCIGWLCVRMYHDMQTASTARAIENDIAGNRHHPVSVTDEVVERMPLGTASTSPHGGTYQMVPLNSSAVLHD